MRVFVTRPIPEVGIAMLEKQGFEVVMNPHDKVLSTEELKKAVIGFDAILSLLTDKINDSVLAAAGPQLRIVANYAVGFDNIDLQAAKNRNIFVTNTPDVLNRAVAEHTWALILSVARKVVQSDQFTREGKYRQWEPQSFLGHELEGQTLGIIGAGRIGFKVAEIGKLGFKMNIIYNDVKPNPKFEKNFQAHYGGIEYVLSNADVVSLHVPLLPSTRHLINGHRLQTMKKTAILVNTSRGPIIDEIALVSALKDKKIFGAGMDVFENEPELAPDLVKLDNVVLTPHIASATTKARNDMSKIAAENIIDVLAGKTPQNAVT